MVLITELVFYANDTSDYDERFPLNIKVGDQENTTVAADITSVYTQAGGGYKVALNTPIAGKVLLVQFNGTNEGLLSGYSATNGDKIQLLAMDIMGYVHTWDASCVNDDSSEDSYGDTCSEYYNDYPSGCGVYEDSDFNSTTQCCACGGGNSSRRQLWGGVSVDTESELESEVTPVGNHDSGTYSYSYSYNYYYGYSYSYSYSTNYSYSYSDGYNYYSTYSYYSYSPSYYSYSDYYYSDYYYSDYYYSSYDDSSSSCDCNEYTQPQTLMEWL